MSTNKSPGYSIAFIFLHQKIEFIRNIEKLVFWAGDQHKLQFAKQDLIAQMNNLNISISGKGFFTLNRQFMAAVSSID